MENTKKNLGTKAQEALHKASQAVQAANEALSEANEALKSMQELSEEELELVAGGESEWTRVPKENEDPIDPMPINP